MNEEIFWENKKVFLTGHTGFKGAWLSLWLMKLGAEVTGYALRPPTSPSLFEISRIEDSIHSIIADICNGERLSAAVLEAQPDIIIHMAAQSLVGESYRDPVRTYETNVMGTVNVLESIRQCASVKSAVFVTTDKCYENREWPWRYRECDRLGGYDPYASSKACDELIVAAYNTSFFQTRPISVATARAGNVIGSGDWTQGRLIPDCVNALIAGNEIELRQPGSIRPWQHVMEALSGYLTLTRHMYEKPHAYDGAWNFGPDPEAERSVSEIVSLFSTYWKTAGSQHGYTITQEKMHESFLLKLDSSKAKQFLAWRPRLTLEKALQYTAEGYQAYLEGENIREVCMRQIFEYMEG